LIFSTKLCGIFLKLKRIQVVLSQVYTGFHVMCVIFFPILNKLILSERISVKFLSFSLMKVSLEAEVFHSDGWMERRAGTHDEDSCSFSHFFKMD